MFFFVAFCFCWIVDTSEWQETWGETEIWGNSSQFNSNQRHQWHVDHLTCVRPRWRRCRLFFLRKGMCILVVGCYVAVFSHPSSLGTFQLLNPAAHAPARPKILRDDLSCWLQPGHEWAKLLWSRCLWRAPFSQRGEPKLNKYSLHPVCIKGLHTWLWRQSDIKQGGVAQPALTGTCTHTHTLLHSLPLKSPLSFWYLCLDCCFPQFCCVLPCLCSYMTSSLGHFVQYIYKMLPLPAFISTACPNFLLVVYAADMKEVNLSQFVSFCRADFTVFLNRPVFLALVFPQISSARCNWPSSHTWEAFPPSFFSAFVSFSETRVHLCVCAHMSTSV